MVIQKKRSLLCEVIVTVIVTKSVVINMCLILNMYRDRAARIHEYKGIVTGNKEIGITYF